MPRTTPPSSPRARRRAPVAFTLIELIVTIVILGVLAGLAYVALGAVVERSQDEAAVIELRALHQEARAVARINGRLEVTYDDFAADGEFTAVEGSHVERVELVAYDQSSEAWGTVSLGVHPTSGNAALAMRSRSGRCASVTLDGDGGLLAEDVADTPAGQCTANETSAEEFNGSIAGMTPPSNLTGWVTDSGDGIANDVNLAWDAVSGATGYTVYRCDASGGACTPSVEVGSTASSGMTDADRPEGDWSYHVVATDGSETTAPSNVATVTAGPPVTTPVNLAAVVADGDGDGAVNDVTLSWDAAAGATSYEVYRCDSTSAACTPNTAVGTTAATTLVDADRPAGDWTYHVVATDGVYTTAASNEATGTSSGMPLVLRFDSTIAGASGVGVVGVPLMGADAEIDWGDGDTDVVSGDGPFTHTYATPGTHTVRVRGEVPWLRGWILGADASKMTAVDSWGEVGLTSLAYAFRNADNLVSVPADLPASVTDLEGAFSGADIFNDASVVSWDTTNVTNMRVMFQNARDFNQPIGGWDTANVTDMAYMLNNASVFNQPIGSWTTVNVTSMRNMFSGASVFNQPIGSWTTTNVTDMSRMFYWASDFNQPLGSWNTANVTSMNSMFTLAGAFNQPIGTWNTANVTDMASMFSNTPFNQPIGTWSTANVTDMSRMFYSAPAFNQPVGSWNTANVTDMNRMFYGATAFNQPVGTWSTANVTDMSRMFYNADAFNRPIGSWNTANVTSMERMFGNTATFNQPINNWNVGAVTNMEEMFQFADVFNQPLNNWNVGAVTNMDRMFGYADDFNRDLSSWTVSQVTTCTQFAYAVFGWTQPKPNFTSCTP